MSAETDGVATTFDDLIADSGNEGSLLRVLVEDALGFPARSSLSLARQSECQAVFISSEARAAVKFVFQDKHAPSALLRSKELAHRLILEGAPVSPSIGHTVFVDDAEGWAVTGVAWPLGQADISSFEDRISRVRLGGAVRQLHEAGDVALAESPRVLDITPDAHTRLNSLFQSRLGNLPEFIPGNVVEKLHGYVDQAQEGLQLIGDRLDTVVHCDTHLGNMVTLYGRPTLIDLDTLSLGPRELDAVAPYMAAKYSMLGMDDFDAYLEGYSQDLDVDLIERLATVRVAGSLTFLAELWMDGARFRSELLKRFATLEGEFQAPWTTVTGQEGLL